MKKNVMNNEVQISSTVNEALRIICIFLNKEEAFHNFIAPEEDKQIYSEWLDHTGIQYLKLLLDKDWFSKPEMLYTS